MISDKDAVENILHENLMPWAYRVGYGEVYVHKDNAHFVRKILISKGFAYFNVHPLIFPVH